MPENAPAEPVASAEIPQPQTEYQPAEFFIHQPGQSQPQKELSEEAVVTNRLTKKEQEIEKSGGKIEFGLKERGVRLGSPENPAWAVEASVPITPKLKSELERLTNISLPDHLTDIRYLDLAPQESMFPFWKRTIPTSLNSKFRSMGILSQALDVFQPELSSRSLGGKFLDRLRKASQSRSWISIFNHPDFRKAGVFADILNGTFSHNVPKREQFERRLNQQKGKELVLAYGHGGNTPHQVGEEFTRNPVNTTEIIDRYDNSEQYAALVLLACNDNKVELNSKEVLLAYSKGPTMPGVLDWKARSEPVISGG